MNKKNIFLCCGVFSLSLLMLFTFSLTYEEINQNEELVAQAIQFEDIAIGEESVIYEELELNVPTQTIYTHANFSKKYSYDDLVADSEFVVYGKAIGITSYVEQGGFFDGNIFSRFDFEVESVLKGDLDNTTIPVITQGGKVTSAEFFAGNEDYLSKKMTAEELEMEKLAAVEKGDIEEVFAGAENVKEGDELLLFLSYDYNDNVYYIVGTSAFGKLNYDQQEEVFYASEINNENGRRLKRRGRLTNLSELDKRVLEIKDNSEKLKEERLKFDSDSDSIMEISK